MEPGPAAIREEGENRTARALLRLADSYIRWKTPEEAVRYPDRVPAQVMDIGTFGDCRSHEGGLRRRAALRWCCAEEPDWFRARSWAFWQAALAMDAGGAPDPGTLPLASW